METCLFCNNYEEGHPDAVDYICSDCTQKMLNLDREKVDRMKSKAIEKNNKRIIKALKLFYSV